MSVSESIVMTLPRNRRLEVELLPSNHVRIVYTHEHRNKGGGTRWVTDETVGANLHEALRGAFNRDTLSKEMWNIINYVKASRLGERIK